MNLPPLTEETCRPGTELRSYQVSYSREDVQTYLERTGEAVDAYVRDGKLQVPPGLLLLNGLRLIHSNYFYETGVYVSSHLHLHRLPLEEEPIVVGGRIKKLFERHGDKYVTLDVVLSDQENKTLATIEHTSIYELRDRS